MGREELICECILNSYKDLERLCDICDKTILKYAIKSHGNDIYKAFDVITSLMNEKNIYCNIKVILDDAINRLKNNTELKQRYVFGVRIMDMQEVFGLKENTIVKRIKRQKEKLFSCLQSKYSFEQLYDFIKNSKYLMNRYRRLCNDI